MSKQRVERTMQMFREEMKKIEKEKGLTAQNVVNSARPKDSPLHKYFEWDDKIAGENFRMAQARHLINIVIEPVVDDNDKTFSYEIIKTKRGREYKHVYDIMDDNEWRRQVVENAIRELAYWRKKYEKYAEFKSLSKEIKKIERRKAKNDKEKARGKKGRIVTTATQNS